MRHQSRIVSEVGQLDCDLDRFADLVLAQSVPKVFKAELAVALRQAGVENELQGSDEVALANFVLADDYDVLAGSHIEFGKVREIRYFYAGDPHLRLLVFEHCCPVYGFAVSATVACAASADRNGAMSLSQFTVSAITSASATAPMTR
jgi:hypothetical protein